MTQESDSKMLMWLGIISLMSVFPLWIVPIILSSICLVKTHRFQKTQEIAIPQDIQNRLTAAMVCSIFSLGISIVKIFVLIVVLVLYLIALNS